MKFNSQRFILRAAVVSGTVPAVSFPVGLCPVCGQVCAGGLSARPLP